MTHKVVIIILNKTIKLYILIIKRKNNLINIY